MPWVNIVFGTIFITVIMGLLIYSSQLKKENKLLNTQLVAKELVIKNQEQELKNKQEEVELIRTERANIEAADKQTIEYLNKQLESLSANSDRLQTLRDSRKSQLLLNAINRNLECKRKNFARTDGKCINGEWKQ